MLDQGFVLSLSKTRSPKTQSSDFEVGRHLYVGQRLSSAENRQRSGNIGLRWGQMTDEQKAPYVEEARRMQEARNSLKGKGLEGRGARQEATEETGLSASQVKRLNHARLDQTLQQVSSHKAWQGGLGIADHVAALRAAHVIPVPDPAAMQGVKRKFDEAFTYNSHVVPNPPLPTFIRPCCTVHAGTCQADAHFDHVNKLAQQFHEGMLGQKLGGAPFLVEIQTLSHRPAADVWVIVATVALRPQCHVVVHLHTADDFLHLTLLNGVMRVGTMHRVLRSLLQESVTRDVAAPDCRAQAFRFGMDSRCVGVGL